MISKNKKSKITIQALKTALGSCMAIYIAEELGLKYAATAGIIALLSIVTTTWETLRLSMFRLLSFVMAVALSGVLFSFIESQWVGFGLFIFILVFVSEWIGWKATISVNAVIGTHMLSVHDFSMAFILNEALLVLIGISVAIILNLIQINSRHRNKIVDNMRYTESHFQTVLEELARYLANERMERNVWDDIITLENNLEAFIENAYEYQHNTFPSHTNYYAHYFEMRMKQCNVLHNLHYEMKKIRSLPAQAGIIADYITYLKQYVIEMNVPTEQLERLHQLFDDMKAEPLPKDHDEFENRAMLYHILMDLEEFLIFKKRFVDSLRDAHFKVYWKSEMGEQKM